MRDITAIVTTAMRESRAWPAVFETGSAQELWRAAHEALTAAGFVIAPREDGWRTIDSAPTDGQAFLAVAHGQVRIVAYTKTSHVPITGFCLADQGAEDFDLCNPTCWQPLPAPPTTEGE